MIRRLWGIRWQIAKVLVGIGLLAAVLSRVEWNEFVGILRDAQVQWLVAVIALVVIDRLFMAAKWRYLLAGLKVKLSFRDTISHYLIGGLVGAALQWSLGGDIARVARVGHATGGRSRVIASVILEKALGTSALGVLAAASLILLDARIDFIAGVVLLPLVLLAVPLLLAMPLILSTPATSEFIRPCVRFLPTARIRNIISRLLESWRAGNATTKVMAGFFALTFLEQIIPSLSLVLLANTYTLSIGFVSALTIMPLISFLSRLPISVEALGIREALYVFFLGMVGVTATQAFILAITARVVDVVVISGAAAAIEGTRRAGDRASKVAKVAS